MTDFYSRLRNAPNSVTVKQLRLAALPQLLCGDAADRSALRAALKPLLVAVKRAAGVSDTEEDAERDAKRGVVPEALRVEAERLEKWTYLLDDYDLLADQLRRTSGVVWRVEEFFDSLDLFIAVFTDPELGKLFERSGAGIYYNDVNHPPADADDGDAVCVAFRPLQTLEVAFERQTQLISSDGTIVAAGVSASAPRRVTFGAMRSEISLALLESKTLALIGLRFDIAPRPVGGADDLLRQALRERAARSRTLRVRFTPRDFVGAAPAAATATAPPPPPISESDRLAAIVEHQRASGVAILPDGSTVSYPPISPALLSENEARETAMESNQFYGLERRGEAYSEQGHARIILGNLAAQQASGLLDRESLNEVALTVDPAAVIEYTREKGGSISVTVASTPIRVELPPAPPDASLTPGLVTLESADALWPLALENDAYPFVFDGATYQSLLHFVEANRFNGFPDLQEFIAGAAPGERDIAQAVIECDCDLAARGIQTRRRGYHRGEVERAIETRIASHEALRKLVASVPRGVSFKLVPRVIYRRNADFEEEQFSTDTVLPPIFTRVMDRVRDALLDGAPVAATTAAVTKVIVVEDAPDEENDDDLLHDDIEIVAKVTPEAKPKEKRLTVKQIGATLLEKPVKILVSDAAMVLSNKRYVEARDDDVVLATFLHPAWPFDGSRELPGVARALRATARLYPELMPRSAPANVLRAIEQDDANLRAELVIRTEREDPRFAAERAERVRARRAADERGEFVLIPISSYEQAVLERLAAERMSWRAERFAAAGIADPEIARRELEQAQIAGVADDEKRRKELTDEALDERFGVFIERTAAALGEETEGAGGGSEEEDEDETKMTLEEVVDAEIDPRTLPEFAESDFIFGGQHYISVEQALLDLVRPRGDFDTSVQRAALFVSDGQAHEELTVLVGATAMFDAYDKQTKARLRAKNPDSVPNAPVFNAKMAAEALNDAATQRILAAMQRQRLLQNPALYRAAQRMLTTAHERGTQLHLDLIRSGGVAGLGAKDPLLAELNAKYENYKRDVERVQAQNDAALKEWNEREAAAKREAAENNRPEPAPTPQPQPIPDPSAPPISDNERNVLGPLLAKARERDSLYAKAPMNTWWKQLDAGAVDADGVALPPIEAARLRLSDTGASSSVVDFVSRFARNTVVDGFYLRTPELDSIGRVLQLVVGDRDAALEQVWRRDRAASIDVVVLGDGMALLVGSLVQAEDDDDGYWYIVRGADLRRADPSIADRDVDRLIAFAEHTAQHSRFLRATARPLGVVVDVGGLGDENSASARALRTRLELRGHRFAQAGGGARPVFVATSELLERSAAEPLGAVTPYTRSLAGTWLDGAVRLTYDDWHNPDFGRYRARRYDVFGTVVGDNDESEPVKLWRPVPLPFFVLSEADQRRRVAIRFPSLAVGETEASTFLCVVCWLVGKRTPATGDASFVRKMLYRSNLAPAWLRLNGTVALVPFGNRMESELREYADEIETTAQGDYVVVQTLRKRFTEAVTALGAFRAKNKITSKPRNAREREAAAAAERALLDNPRLRSTYEQLQADERAAREDLTLVETNLERYWNNTTYRSITAQEIDFNAEHMAEWNPNIAVLDSARVDFEGPLYHVQAEGGGGGASETTLRATATLGELRRRWASAARAAEFLPPQESQISQLVGADRERELRELTERRWNDFFARYQPPVPYTTLASMLVLDADALQGAIEFSVVEQTFIGHTPLAQREIFRSERLSYEQFAGKPASALASRPGAVDARPPSAQLRMHRSFGADGEAHIDQRDDIVADRELASHALAEDEDERDVRLSEFEAPEGFLLRQIVLQNVLAAEASPPPPERLFAGGNKEVTCGQLCAARSLTLEFNAEVEELDEQPERILVGGFYIDARITDAPRVRIVEDEFAREQRRRDRESRVAAEDSKRRAAAASEALKRAALEQEIGEESEGEETEAESEEEPEMAPPPPRPRLVRRGAGASNDDDDGNK